MWLKDEINPARVQWLWIFLADSPNSLKVRAIWQLDLHWNQMNQFRLSISIIECSTRVKFLQSSKRLKCDITSPTVIWLTERSRIRVQLFTAVQCGLHVMDDANLRSFHFYRDKLHIQKYISLMMVHIHSTCTILIRKISYGRITARWQRFVARAPYVCGCYWRQLNGCTVNYIMRYYIITVAT